MLSLCPCLSHFHALYNALSPSPMTSTSTLSLYSLRLSLSPKFSLCGSASAPDLTSINGYAYWVGLGVYHFGVQVHGVEHAFGAHEYPTIGIFEGEPKQCEGFTFRKTILIGKTDVGLAEVRTVMEELAENYKGNAYNLITKNLTISAMMLVLDSL